MIKKSFKKKNLILFSMFLVLCIAGVLAAMGMSKEVDNVFTVGSVDITLTEPNWDTSATNGVLSQVVPAQKLKKDPTITNTGENDAYVYVMVEVPKAYRTNVKVDGVIESKNHHQLFDYAINEGWKLIASKTGDDNEAYNYYVYAYENPLEKGDTAVVFDEIVLANITSELVHPLTGEEITDLDVKVTGYAIQSDFYGNEASDATTAWTLYVNQNNWKWPSNPYEGSLRDIENKHKILYYSKFSLAVTDVSNDEIGVNADVERPDAVAGIYTAEGEAPTIVLFKDAEETGTIDLKANMNINLGGNTLNLNNSPRGLWTNNSGCEIFIDGRIEGSEISSVSTGSTNARCLTVHYTDTVIVVDTILKTNAENGDATAAFCGGALTLTNCNVVANSRSGASKSVSSNGSDNINLIVENCSINAKSVSGNTSGILANQGYARIANCQIDASSESSELVQGIQCGHSSGLVANALVSETNIYVTALNSNALVYGIQNSGPGEMCLETCNVRSISQGQTRGIAITATNSILCANNCTVLADSPYRANVLSYNSPGIFICEDGTMILENCNIKGVHSGIQNEGNLHIDGGTYQGWGHGGIYFAGSNNNAYVKNANLGQWDYDGQYNTTNMATNNGAAMYIGGNSGHDNIKVYMDNCKLTALRQVIVLRGTDGEKNNTLHISNSTINTHDIRIDNTTHKLYIGKGCNFDVNSVASNKSVVTQTDEVYNFDIPIQ